MLDNPVSSVHQVLVLIYYILLVPISTVKKDRWDKLHVMILAPACDDSGTCT